jgi:hypothetical protein
MGTYVLMGSVRRSRYRMDLNQMEMEEMVTDNASHQRVNPANAIREKQGSAAPI